MILYVNIVIWLEKKYSQQYAGSVEEVRLNVVRIECNVSHSTSLQDGNEKIEAKLLE